MFYPPEVLAKRESGVGLAWLAGTLGSKSSFKKLPRRSILTADIPQLCELISHPSEPLALRLSSNLMVGVARVYKIKHDLFLGDINNCFALLRKAVQDIHKLGGLSEAQLQMGQPSVRPDALTLTADPTVAVALELDALDTNWGDLSSLSFNRVMATEEDRDDDDDEFTPGNRSKGKSKSRANASTIPSEIGRAGLHTLDEQHGHLLSTSFDASNSFLADLGFAPSSSQADSGLRFGSFTFDNDLFGANEQFDLGLGEMDSGDLQGLNGEFGDASAPLDVNLGGPDPYDFQMMDEGANIGFGVMDSNIPAREGSIPGRKRPFSEKDKENQPPSEFGIAATPHTALAQTPARSSFFDEAFGEAPQQDALGPDGEVARTSRRKPRKTKIPLDRRTELTDEELKAARARYVEDQRMIKMELERKKQEKESAKSLEAMVWGVPDFLVAPALAEFWSDAFKRSVEATSGGFHLRGEEPPYKRQRLQDEEAEEARIYDPYGNVGDMGGAYDFDMMQDGFDAPIQFDNPSQMRSSEEPERGRNAGSLTSANLAFDADLLNPSSGTQRSAFFPWDNAAGSSSTGNAALASLGRGSDRLSLGQADIRLHSQSGSRGGSPSFIPGVDVASFDAGFSPLSDRGLFGISDEFRFDVGEDTAQQTLQTQGSTVILEKNALNFLEYCKMQAQGLPGHQSRLSFDDIVPPKTSSRRVAAAAFHNCLLLATKDLLVVGQADAYGPLSVRVK